MRDSKNYQVFADGVLVESCDTQVVFDGIDEMRMIYAPYISSFASVEAQDKVLIEVVPLFTDVIQEVKIQPESACVQETVSNGKISFYLPADSKVTLTVNGCVNQILMLFVNQKQAFMDDGNTIYFGKGIHKIEDNPENQIILQSNQRLYLDSGAIVLGRIYARNCENIRIEGHGVLCGSENSGRWAQWLRPMVGSRDEEPRVQLVILENCKNVTINGVVFVDSDEWTVKLINCEQVEVSNIKVIGYQSNSDGIDFCSCRHVHMENSFVRTSDDCIVLKAFTGMGNTQNVLIERCILWADRANALEIGHEVCGNEICDVTYRDIDILQCAEPTYGYHAIDITNADSGAVHDILYDTIRIEDCARMVGFRMREGRFSDSEMIGKGEVYNIHLKNIISQKDAAIVLSGRDETHKVHHITFENVVACGEKMFDLKRVMHNHYVEDVALCEGEHEIAALEKPPLSFRPLDIRSMCNLTLGREKGIYGVEGEDWVTLPSGVHIWEGVPFQITGQGYDEQGLGDYKRVVVPPNRINLPFPAQLSLDEKAEWIYFLHTTVNPYSAIDLTAATYAITYEDGSVCDIPVRNLNDSNDLYAWSMAGWQPVWQNLRFYIMPWKNPFPQKRICGIEMKDGNLHELQILLGITLA